MFIEELNENKNIPDRYIPPRAYRKTSSYPNHLTNHLFSNQEIPQTYEKFISKEMFSEQSKDYQSGYMNRFYWQLVRKRNNVVEKQVQRTFNLSPEKILDAPELKDDYYLNLLDWNSKGTLSIGLGDKVYLYSPAQITQLCHKMDDYICSVSFHPQGDTLAVGLSNGKVELYDVENEVLVRTLRGHTNRVSSSSFTYSTLFTGSKDSLIIGHDFRAHHNITMKLEGHRGQICGLKHDPCGLASGSNDNLAMIWDLSMNRQRFQLQGHKAAVKALAWCPWQRNLLATGGGSSDKTMRFWNIESGKIINVVNTESQVCSLVWNKQEKQILSSHGYSKNQICIWRYPDCNKIVELQGHKQRVLHMCMSPDNSTICTASADQTLRFWRIFSNGPTQRSQQKDYCKLNEYYTTLR